MSLISKLINPHLVALKPYESARRLYSGGQDWLNANESPYANTYQLDDSTFNRYPSCQPPDVVQGYANYASVDSSQVLVTRGADEGIELLIRAFCQPDKDKVLICPPTYGMYAISAETSAVGVYQAPLKTDFSLDVEAIFAFKNQVNLVFICSPNNPTGTSVDPKDLETVIKHFSDSALVVVDEAYLEFDKGHSAANTLDQYPNLVVLRTLSKAFALAGIRCGFTLAAPDVIQSLLKVIAPYPIPEPVAQIAAQALSKSGLAQMQAQVDELTREKVWLKAALAKLPNVELVGDDKANFILFRHPQKNAIMQDLVAQGILIRDQSKQLNLQGCLRVSIGTQVQNQRLLNALKQVTAIQESA